MSMTGFEPFDKAVHKAFIWLDEIMKELGTDDRHRAYLALRGTLHALRDRLNADEAAQLAAQLPVLIRGIYYEGWDPSKTPVKIRHKEAFLERIAREFTQEPDLDAEAVARAVFKTLERHITPGEIEDIQRMLPKELRELWP